MFVYCPWNDVLLQPRGESKVGRPRQKLQSTSHLLLGETVTPTPGAPHKAFSIIIINGNTVTINIRNTTATSRATGAARTHVHSSISTRTKSLAALGPNVMHDTPLESSPSESSHCDKTHCSQRSITTSRSRCETHTGWRILMLYGRWMLLSLLKVRLQNHDWWRRSFKPGLRTSTMPRQ